MSVDLNNLWFLSLEIEGLISVLREKEDNDVVSALPHLKEKISQLADGVTLLTEAANEPRQTFTEPAEDECETLPHNDLVEEPEPESEQVSEQTVTVVEYPAEDKQPSGFVEYPKQIIIIESRVPDNAPSDDVISNEDEEPTESPVTENEADDNELIAENAEFEEQEDACMTDCQGNDTKTEQSPVQTPVAEPIRVDKKLSRTVSRDIRRAFTINDKFLYRRELFGNSNQQYNDALELIAEMNSFEEAESYFFDNYGWDRENSHVKRFMEIIEDYFAS